MYSDRDVRAGGGSIAPDASGPVVAGVMFVDESSYLCFPLSRFGVASARDVVSVDSSCDCAEGSLLAFRDVRGDSVDALRIDFIPEKKVEGGDRDRSRDGSGDGKAASLMVELTLQLRSGGPKTVTVEFLHTTRVASDSSSSSSSNAQGGGAS